MFPNVLSYAFLDLHVKGLFMARRAEKRRSTSRNSEPAASDRFRYVLRARYANSQSAMARELGCSQSYLSRVVRGEKAPAAKLLNALANLPQIHKHWALTGEGDPFAVDRMNALPVVSELLPGPAEEHPHFLTGSYECVAPHLARDSAYILKVAVPFASHVLPGDRVVLDADASLWTKNLRAFDRKLCAVRRGAAVEFRHLRCCFDDNGTLAELRSFPPDHLKVDADSEAVPNVANPQVDSTIGKLPRGIRFKSKGSTATSAVDLATKAEAYDLISVHDVVAIAIELWRRL